MYHQRSVEDYRLSIRGTLDLTEDIFRPIGELTASENDLVVGKFLMTSLISMVRLLAHLLK